ncbi:unnamed protein product [Medioppia subpectinata]|uniref:RalBP1-associated Eps domain-containing protein 1 n=1 Tax=Medioppia subpectinata TaxID=1979941 RepID=A0A7R9Q176_9ACAR|nr:unnamed protein product [Medioppia subpectinata]CAG2108789.1 unnamed protein product [Medioppia subpectinata]
MEINCIELNDNERQLFSQLFTYYADSENSQIVHKSVAKHLLSSSQLDANVLDQILELSGSSSVPSLSRHQFYSMLKLVGAAQSGLPLNTHTLTANSLIIPLPQLSPINWDLTNKHKLMANNGNCETKTECPISNQMSGSIPPPPTKSTVRYNRRNNQFSTNSDNRQPIQTTNNYNSLSNNHTNNEQSESTVSRSSSENDLNESPIDPKIEKSYNYRDKSWSEFGDKIQDKPKNWADFEESHYLLENEEEEDDEEEAKSNISSEDDSADIFAISDDQRAYYTNQFKSIQTNLNGIITGNKAKDFFEKSCLPIQELSQIWLLSDIDKDGALTLDEFCIAMHLVVLRRNNIDLPSQLPTIMLPLVSMVADTTDGYTVPIPQITAITGAALVTDLVTDCDNNYETQSPSQQNNDLSDSKSKDVETLSPQNKQWTKFTDSPTHQIVATATTAAISPPSTSSSAGLQTLANFDFNAASIGRDPKILHPVALRLSPDGQPIRHNSIETNHSVDVHPDSIRTSTVVQGKKDPPPPPPPRPARSHTRSSSLDLDRHMVRSHGGNDLISSQMPVHLKISNSEYTLTPPKVLSIHQQNVGAFHAYRKTKTDASLAKNTNNLNNSNNYEVEKLRNRFKLPPEVPIPKNPSDTIELWKTIKSLQEYSKTLVDLNNELLLEVIKVIEDKHCLELRLAQLNNGYKS